MSNEIEDSSKICISCSKSYTTPSFIMNLGNCNHDVCKVCLYDNNAKTGSQSCPYCQYPIAEQQLEMILKCTQDTNGCLEDISYQKIYQSAGGILVRRIDGIVHYLAVLQKRFNMDLQWVSPKGRLEGTETSLEAAKREISEEVGLQTLTLIDFICKQCYSYTESDKMYKKTVFWYLFNVEEPNELKLNDEEGFIEGKWLSFEECLSTFSHETFIEIIKMADSVLKE
ncbi:RNA pyrophosphohydrolase-like [Parasteatoda tepidariorum]|uniref:RNA pyrophosphohydrolase-like n=1 Tax=Parasteatoda tepidariorum TaxID=114398 RepID=UPI00077F9791|nr:RNA pyrophosphohydrolase isoform X1 [Parasteatoda tepidariorum]XP_042901254.1 RNA pyrophosphohydrolase isoform X1 [Parasteatoda tepidariorum]